LLSLHKTGGLETTFACNKPKACIFPFSWQPLLTSTLYTSCTSDGISGKLSYYWCSKKDKYNTGDDYATCSCDNVLAIPDTYALSLCLGNYINSLGQNVLGTWTSAGVLSQDCSSQQCNAIRSNWTGTYTVCNTVNCHGGAKFTSRNNSLTTCSLASALRSCAALLMALSAATISLLVSWQ
jgi:hypothetical protein